MPSLQPSNWATMVFQPVRLIGMTAERWSRIEGQLDLFAQPQHDKQRRVDAATDTIVRKFGKTASRRCAMCKPHPGPVKRSG